MKGIKGPKGDAVSEQGPRGAQGPPGIKGKPGDAGMGGVMVSNMDARITSPFNK